MIFCCDLDNTLIFSYKHDLGEAKQCVEHYQGKELSFMTDQALHLLTKLSQQVLLVPTTTRSVEQYNRIHLGTIQPEYALVCNGGILLRGGVKDDAWYQESKALVRPADEVIRRAVAALESDSDRDFEIRYLEELFLFTKSKAPEQSVQRLRQQLDQELVDVFSNGTKVYVLPKMLTKGNAVLRLKQRLVVDGIVAADRGFATDRIIAAGDSEFDIPMLLAADYGYCPEGLMVQEEKHIKAFPSAEFCWGMLREVERESGNAGYSQTDTG